ncbi:MAG TPA: TetR/AcrR family transcriptional regulator [Bryobacteraceae bacterium]|nr:TetR/AcrR family transcriptional regulator [Bryobacteraceae bacterium]
MQKPRLSGEERRQSIIDAACKLFSDKGFRGVTTRELAVAVGVTEPVLYEHFRTKRDLYSAIIETQANEGIRIVSAINDRFRQAPDDRAFFLSLGIAIVDWYVNDKAFIRLLLFSSLENHELKDLFHERSSECFAIVAAYIEQRIAQGGFRGVRSDLAARAFFGMIAHYALTALVFGYAPLSVDPREAVEGMVDLFLNGLCLEN